MCYESTYRRVRPDFARRWSAGFPLPELWRRKVPLKSTTARHSALNPYVIRFRWRFLGACRVPDNVPAKAAANSLKGGITGTSCHSASYSMLPHRLWPYVHISHGPCIGDEETILHTRVQTYTVDLLPAQEQPPRTANMFHNMLKRRGLAQLAAEASIAVRGD